MEALTKTETTRLKELESIIFDGLQTFIEVGEALAEVRDSKLYRAKHKTFESYCAEEWEISRRRAYQLITGSEVAREVEDDLCTIVHKTPPTGGMKEAHARELAKAPEGTRAEVWEAASEDGPPTAEKVAKAVEAATEPDAVRKTLKAQQPPRNGSPSIGKVEAAQQAARLMGQVLKLCGPDGMGWDLESGPMNGPLNAIIGAIQSELDASRRTA